MVENFRSFNGMGSNQYFKTNCWSRFNQQPYCSNCYGDFEYIPFVTAKAYTFMEEIINTLQYLEGHLDRHKDSPFRQPVSKFLNRFAENCIEYLIANFKTVNWVIC